MKPASRLARLAMVAIVALALPASACSMRENLHAESATAGGVRVEPTEAFIKGHKLFARLLVTNDSNAPVTVRRDLMTAHPTRETNGVIVAQTSVGRATGQTGWQMQLEAKAYALAPGQSHMVNVEFRDQGFDWSDMSEVEIDLGDAIVRNDGGPLSVPDIVVRR
jgi:hypothetical protein